MKSTQLSIMFVLVKFWLMDIDNSLNYNYMSTTAHITTDDIAWTLITKHDLLKTILLFQNFIFLGDFGIFEEMFFGVSEDFYKSKDE